MAIGTSSQSDRAKSLIRLLGIEEYFSVFITANDVNKHKPDPQVFLEAAKKLGIIPENCVVIEDAPVGIEAAKRGNMKAIAILRDYNTKEELKKADLTINSFSELDYDKLSGFFVK